MSKQVVKGNEITAIRTLKTMYDADSIEVMVDTGEKDDGGVFNIVHYYRIKVNELLPLIRERDWTCEKARKHTYLKEVSDEYAEG